MTGTPSRTATAESRDEVEKKLQAKPWPEEHEAHRGVRRWARPLGRSKPDVIRTDGRRCDGYMGRRSRVLPREICSSALAAVHGGSVWALPRSRPGPRRERASAMGANKRAPCTGQELGRSEA